MAIQYNENIKIAAPAPLDKRYLSTRTSGGAQVPYSACTEVNTTIISSERYTGLTVNIGGVEYWYKDGVLDSCLIEKKYDSVIPVGDFVTGATNIGYFSGKSGQQILYIDAAGATNDGNYHSQYNYYYVDSNAVISIPADDSSDVTVLRRGYVRTCAPASIKSWIFSCASICSYNVGWQLVDGDIRQCVGGYLPPIAYAGPQFQETQWLYNGGIGGTGFYNSGGTLTVQVYGSLTTGSTLTIGGRPYDYFDHNNLHFRTIMTETPSVISVRDNDAFIYISGKTSLLNASNVGTGANVFSGQTETDLYFRRLRGSGNTQVTAVGDSVVIFTSLSGGTTYITGATNIGSSGGTGVFDSRDNVTLQFNKLVGSGNTTISKVGDDVIIHTSAPDEYYNLSSPAAITVGGISGGTILTGKTAFELFEELLVPELYGSITAPSLSIGLTCTGCKEIGTVISQTVTGTFSRGAINPQYCSVSPFRSGCVNAYCFAGCGMPSGWQSCVLSPGSATNASYIVSAGTQTWSVQAQYDAGFPALGSKGTEYCAALPSGTTSIASGSVCGILPWYWGVSSSGTINGTCVANGNKTLATVGASTPITFNATAQYLWFAAPAGTYTTKTKWWVCAANAGNIGGTGNLWAAACNVSVSSLEGCWSGCSYDVYVTCGITTTATGIPMCLYY